MPPPGHSEPLSPDHCRLCWLWHHRADYRELWDDQHSEHAVSSASNFLPHDCHDADKLDRFFGRVVVINLRRRPDRLTTFRRELHRNGWPFQVPHRFEAIDGESMPVPPDWRATHGAWGCMQSHRQVLERAIADDVASLMVLEDDLKLKNSFASDVQHFLKSVPDDWDQLMLGGQHMAVAEPVCPGVVRCINCQRTHAYAIRGRMLRDLYAEWHSSRGNTHCDHIMGPMQAHYRVYAPDPFLVGQGRSHSDITLVSTPANFWNAPSGDEPVVVVEAPRDVVEALRERGLHTGFHSDPVTGIDVGLQQVFGSNRTALRPWLDQLQRECISDDALLLGVWHPQATVDAVRNCWKGSVYHLRAVTVEEGLQQLTQIRERL